MHSELYKFHRKIFTMTMQHPTSEHACLTRKRFGQKFSLQCLLFYVIPTICSRPILRRFQMLRLNRICSAELQSKVKTCENARHDWHSTTTMVFSPAFNGDTGTKMQLWDT